MGGKIYSLDAVSRRIVEAYEERYGKEDGAGVLLMHAAEARLAHVGRHFTPDYLSLSPNEKERRRGLDDLFSSAAEAWARRQTEQSALKASTRTREIIHDIRPYPCEGNDLLLTVGDIVDELGCKQGWWKGES